MLTFSELVDEVKRRSARDQSNDEFTTGIKRVINTSLSNIARVANWRPLRREGSFQTVIGYSTGSGACTVTNNSTSFSVVGAQFVTNNIQPGRLISFQTSSTYYTIASITSETTGTITTPYSGTTTSTASYQVLPQEKYNLPIQATHRCWMWNRGFGYPFLMKFVPDFSFRDSSVTDTISNVPLVYRLWGENNVIEQPKTPSVVSVSSTSASDTSISTTIFGVVSGYPDSESITVTGTAPVAGTKVFSSIDRVVKGGSSVGRIQFTTSAGTTTVSVIPAGDATNNIMFRKVELWPLPSTVMDINVMYYKEPYALVNDDDIHELGNDFDEAIILLSTAKMNYELNKEEGDRFKRMYDDEIKNLRNYYVDNIAWLVAMERASAARLSGIQWIRPFYSYNQLGGFYGPASGLYNY